MVGVRRRRRRNGPRRGQRLVGIGGRGRGVPVFRCRHVAAVEIDAGRASGRQRFRDLTLDAAESDVDRRSLAGSHGRRRDRCEYHHGRVRLIRVVQGGLTRERHGVSAGRQERELVVVRRHRGRDRHLRGQRLVGVATRVAVHVFGLRHGAAVEIDPGRAPARQRARDLPLDVAHGRVVNEALHRLEDARGSLPRRARDRLSQVEVNRVVDDAAARDGEPGNQLKSRFGAARHSQTEPRAVGEIDVGIIGAAVRRHHQPDLAVGARWDRLIEQHRGRSSALRHEIDALRRGERDGHRIAAVAGQLDAGENDDDVRGVVSRRSVGDRQLHLRLAHRSHHSARVAAAARGNSECRREQWQQ